MRIMAGAVQAYGPTDFRLEGGTALSAYYLHHRESEHLDFFAGLPVEMRAFIPFIQQRLTETGLLTEEPRAPNTSFGELLVSDPAESSGLTVRAQLPVAVGAATYRPCRSGSWYRSRMTLSR